MSWKVYLPIVILAFVLWPSVYSLADSPTCSNPVGIWENALQSTMTITSIGGANKLEGNYSSEGGKAQGPLTGWLNTISAEAKQKRIEERKNNHFADSVITFSVQWGPKYDTLTGWTGYCRETDDKGNKQVPTITGMWHYAKTGSDFRWDHIVTNVDIFTPSQKK